MGDGMRAQDFRAQGGMMPLALFPPARGTIAKALRAVGLDIAPFSYLKNRTDGVLQ